MMSKTILLLAIALTLANGQLYDALYKKLAKKGIKNTIPVSSLGKPLKVTLSLMVVMVENLNPETGDLDLDLWMNTQWKDDRLSWNPDQFSNISAINMQHSDIWRPDVITYGGRTQQFPEMAVVSQDGSVVYVPVTRIRYRCDVSDYVTNGTVTCNIKIGSWTYSGQKLDLFPGPKQVVDISEFMTDRWEIVDHSGERKVKKYDCCPENYPSLVFKLVFKDNKSKKGYFNIF